jgi:phosphoglycerate dehydrogenase-like enzyme
MPLKIVVPDPPFFSPKLLRALCHRKGIEFVVYDSLALDAAQLQVRIKDADIIVVDVLSRYNAQSLAECKKLKHLISASIGLNHVDLAYCEQRGIAVHNFAGYNARAVAEMAFANLISLLRHVPRAAQSVRSNLWLTDYFEGEELEGKTLGVIGAGSIGTELVRIGKGFGMRALCYTRHSSDERATQLGIKQFSQLPELLRESDFVVLAIPGSPETDGIINEAALKLMKPTSYLINEGRYSLVDAHALARALYRQKLAGAALDFVGAEPYELYGDDPEIQEMVNRPNVIVTPHIGFNTKEAMQRLSTEVRDLVVRLAS